jgi:hypothetical protein
MASNHKQLFNVPKLGEVAKFGTNYFLSKIIFLAKRECELTTKLAIATSGCYVLPLIHSFESSEYPQKNMDYQRKKYKKESKI